jgi:regulatory protein
MPKITSIVTQKNKNRVSVFLDDKFSFGIDLDNFFKFKLKVEQELSEEEIEKIKETSNKKKILDNIIKFAMIRPRSEKEIVDWLKRRHIDVLIHRYVIKKLAGLKLINDLDFAKWWVEMRLSQGKSQRSMIYDLRSKGISVETIKQVLSEVEIDEVKMAKDLINKKMYKWQRFDEKIRRQKISQYLLGKGFDWNVINNVVKFGIGE